MTLLSAAPIQPASDPDVREPPALEASAFAVTASLPLAGDAPAVQPARRGRGAGILVAAGVGALKLLKAVKAVKILLFAGFLWSLALNHPFPFAIALAYAIFVHESGHLLAMKRLGLQTSGMWFLPFLGAAAVAKQPFRSCGEEYFVAIAGPVFGLLSLVPLSAAALLIPNDWVPAGDWLGYIATAAFVNLFNLLPIGILDGGRIVKTLASSLSRVLGFIVVGSGLLLCGALVAWIGGFVLGIILCLSIVELVRRRKQAPLPPMSRRAVLSGVAAYVGLFGAFAAAAMIALHLAQSLGAA